MAIASKLDSTENLTRVLKALGDTSRLNIVISIGKKARSVSELVKATGLSQTLVSFHLRVLREANVVTTERNGPFIFYSLSNPNLNNTLSELAKATKSNGGQPKELAEISIQEGRSKRGSR